MAQPAPLYPTEQASVPTADRFGAVAAGGPIADLQRSLEERLLAADRPSTPAHVEGDIPNRLSRLAGPALLVGGYLAVAAWLF